MGSETANASLVSEQLSAGDALHALLKHRHVEVDQEAQRFSVQFQIRENLCRVNRMQFRDSFDFNDQHLLNYKIQPVSAIEMNLFVANWQWLLSLKMEASLRQLVSQTFFVRGF